MHSADHRSPITPHRAPSTEHRAPFFCGPFLVQTTPEPGTPWTRYRVTYKGLKLGEQLSRPDLVQCSDRAVEAFQKRQIDRDTLRAIRQDVAEAGHKFPQPTLRLVHSERGFNNRRRNPNDPADITRTCDTCEEERPLTAFLRNGAGKREYTCRYCKAVRAAKRAKARA